jgi:hypothetical protein
MPMPGRSFSGAQTQSADGKAAQGCHSTRDGIGGRDGIIEFPNTIHTTLPARTVHLIRQLQGEG